MSQTSIPKLLSKSLLLGLFSLFLFTFQINNNQLLAKEVPLLHDHVNDYANIISSSTEQRLNTILLQHEQATSNQIFVLTVNRIEDDFLEGYALKVAETWKIGQKGKDNGALLLVSIQDRKVRIEVGYGLEQFLTDAKSSRIIRNELAPQFRKGNYDAGFTNAVNAMVGTIDGTYTPAKADKINRKTRRNNQEEGDPLGMAIVLAVMSIFLFNGFLAPGASGWIIFFMISPFMIAIFVAIFGPQYGFLAYIIFAIIYFAIRAYFFNTPKGRKMIEDYKKRQKDQKARGGRGWSGGGWYGGTWSSGGSTWSSGGGGGSSWGGGGFGGGGGSFGGGGASDSW